MGATRYFASREYCRDHVAPRRTNTGNCTRCRQEAARIAREAEKAREIEHDQNRFVAAKMPNGVLLRTFKMRPIQAPVVGGGYRDTMMAEEVPGSRFAVRGLAIPHGVPHPYPVVGGFALTEGPADIWRGSRRGYGFGRRSIAPRLTDRQEKYGWCSASEGAYKARFI